MSGYRFCRTDDIPLLCEAYARCYAPYVDDAPAYDKDRFRARMREGGLWASSCMVAVVDAEVVGVLFGAKRKDANSIVCVGVREDHRRRGHARHMIESLSRKMAILKPTRMTAEIPEGHDVARALLAECGFEREATLVDWTRSPGPRDPAAPPGIAALAVPIAFSELVEAGALEPHEASCWSRHVENVGALGARVRALAVATDRIEAFVAWEGERVLALGAADGDGAGVLLGGLLDRAADESPGGGPRSFAGVAPAEWDGKMLMACGFVAGRATERWAAEAVPG